MITKPIDKSQIKSRIILQRDLVIMRFTLMGKRIANMRTKTMKITCENEEAREKTMPRSADQKCLQNMLKSTTTKRRSKQKIPLYNKTIETKISEILRLRRVNPKTEFLCFLSRPMIIICTELAMKPSDPVPIYMQDSMVKCVF